MQNTTKAQLLFIAELNSFKQGSLADKIQFGIECYAEHKLHHLITEERPITVGICEELLTPKQLSNLTMEEAFKEATVLEKKRAEKDRSEVHENIWLQRIYEEMDYVHGVSTPLERKLAVDVETISDNYQWSVPIELDASASMLQYEGALLGDKRLLAMTNCTTEDGITDPWGTIEGVPRFAVKKRFTPSLYGSSQSTEELLKKAKYSDNDIKLYKPLIEQEQHHGAFGLANKFKDFIINNANPKANMTVNIWGEKFNVECNRYKNIGEYFKFYKVFDTKANKCKPFKNTHVKRVPDLKQFRRYFVTLLIHNLDSQVANYVSGKLHDKYGWVIPIHDAFIVPPQAALDCRTWYAEKLTEIYNNRETILANYFKSIGISAKATKQWKEVKDAINPISNFKCDLMALK